MEASSFQIRPRERKGDRTRARLVGAALEEFRQVGLDRASVARIAQAAGVSRPTFYFHFPAKEDVLLEFQQDLEHVVAERISQGPSLNAALAAFVEGLVDLQRELGGAMLLGDMLRIHLKRPEGPPIEAPDSPVVDALAQKFTEAAARGELRKGMDAGQAASLCLKSVFGYLIISPGDSEQSRSDLQALTSLYLETEESKP